MQVYLIRDEGCPSSVLDSENFFARFGPLCKDSIIEYKGTFSGSSYPSKYYVLKTEPGELKKSMYDGTIQPEFQETCEMARKSNAEALIGSLVDFLCMFNHQYPIPESGNYSFSLSDKNKEKASGHYDPFALWVEDGKEIRTINANVYQNYRYVADQIWVHRGRKQSESQRDSSGCLTINPTHWTSFINVFPPPLVWKQMEMSGVLRISRPDLDQNFPKLSHDDSVDPEGDVSRQNSSPPSAPSNLRIMHADDLTNRKF